MTMGLKKDSKEGREQQIFNAAYKILGEKGYKATSMLAIAKEASASNETLYAWYNNKQGLLAAMISDNANIAEKLFARAILTKEPTSVTLQKAGTTILKIITGERAVILNRAAAADVSEGGILGGLIARYGRHAVTPMISKVFARAIEEGRIKDTDPDEITEIFVALLVGDSQMRRVIGVADELNEEIIETHTERCIEIIFELYGA